MDGPEANVMPILATLDGWVEKGKAPEQLVAARLDPVASLSQPDLSGKVSFTRPVCQYGSYPRYKGMGDQSAAASFRCTVF